MMGVSLRREEKFIKMDEMRIDGVEGVLAIATDLILVAGDG